MLVINGTLITWEWPNRILENQAMLVRDGKIVEIGPQADLLSRFPAEERFDATIATSCRAISVLTPISTGRFHGDCPSPARLRRISLRS